MPSLIMLSETIWGKIISAFDSTVYGLISGYISEGMTRFMIFITFWGSELGTSIITFLILFATFVWKRKKYISYGLLISVNIIVGVLLNYILKQLFHRPRPDLLKLVEIGGYSFPSGHSMASMIFYGFLVYLSIRYVKHWSKYCIAGILGLLIIAIGISRIYLGVHYASDVLGGFIVGLGWLIVFIKLSERFVFSKRKSCEKYMTKRGV